jgi:hypothetical protein
VQVVVQECETIPSRQSLANGAAALLAYRAIVAILNHSGRFFRAVALRAYPEILGRGLGRAWFSPRSPHPLVG